MKSPSVCNRQPWKVHLIEDEQLLHQVMTAQGGFAGNGHNMQLLLLVTVDLRYFSTSSERNQGFVDGGIYLMSLVYALTYHKMATCILNADFPNLQHQFGTAILIVSRYTEEGTGLVSEPRCSTEGHMGKWKFLFGIERIVAALYELRVMN
jgi:nitroreductase